MAELDGTTVEDVASQGGTESQSTTTPEPKVDAPTPSPLEPGGARFEQVYGKMKDYETKYNMYKEYGDPASLKSRLDKLTEWEKTVEQHRAQAALTPDEKQEAERQLLIQKELFKVMPSLKMLDKIEQLEKRLEEVQGSSFENQAAVVLEKHSLKFTDVLKSTGIDTKFQSKIEDYIVNQMSPDERLAFVKGDFSIAKQIFDNELKDGLFSVMRKENPQQYPLPTPPVRNTPGGTPPKSKTSHPTTLKEAEDIAWARLSGKG